MNIVKIVEIGRKLNDKQVDLLKEIFKRGKFNIYSLLGRFLTLTAAGALYKCAIDIYNVGLSNSIAYAILGTHLVFNRYIISALTATSFALGTKRDIKQCTKEINKMIDMFKK